MILKFQMDVMVNKFNFKDLTNEYYDPTKNLIFEYKTNKIKRTPNQEEIKWIITQCRYKESPSRAKLISGKDDEIGRASCRERLVWCRSRWSPYH